MFNTQRDHLFTLIKSLNKAEKRSFKLYANRSQSGSDSKFIQLFDVIDRLSDYDEGQILKRMPGVKKRHLANLKRHLYKQILISLRLIYINKNIDIQIREQLDFARILYGKGMYMQALKLLDRIKQIALEHHQDILHLEILEFEKFIEARHITRSRSVVNKIENLLEESSRRSFVTHTTSLLSNLSIQIQGWYIQHGHVKSKEDLTEVKAYFDSIFPEELPFDTLTFFEKINLYQSYMWYHYIRLDFNAGQEEARKWVALFEQFPQMQEKDPNLFMRGLYYLLVFLYLRGDPSGFRKYLTDFETFCQEQWSQLNANSRMTSFVYVYLSKINMCLLEDNFEEGLRLAPEIMKSIQNYEAHMDPHRILLFHYKLGYLYFGTGRFEKALDHLNKITVLQTGFLRDDLHSNSRLLHLLCHYELGNFDLLDYLIPQVQRALEKASDTSRWQQMTLQFLQELIKLHRRPSLEAFTEFQNQTRALLKNPYESKALTYLDIPAWVSSQLHQCTIQEFYIREKEKVKNDN